MFPSPHGWRRGRLESPRLRMGLGEAGEDGIGGTVGKPTIQAVEALGARIEVFAQGNLVLPDPVTDCVNVHKAEN